MPACLPGCLNPWAAVLPRELLSFHYRAQLLLTTRPGRLFWLPVERPVDYWQKQWHQQLRQYNPSLNKSPATAKILPPNHHPTACCSVSHCVDIIDPFSSPLLSPFTLSNGSHSLAPAATSPAAPASAAPASAYSTDRSSSFIPGACSINNINNRETERAEL